jgi:flavodoxin
MPLAAIDYNDKMAIAAVIGKEEPEGRERIVAIGRYINNPNTRYAEVAFTTHQDWQARGIGTFLLRYLIRIAREKNIAGFTADVLSSNKPMMHVFSKSGHPMTTHLDTGVYELKINFAKEAKKMNSQQTERQGKSSMDTRRDFIKKSVMVCTALSLPLTFAESGRALPREYKIRNPKRALVLCYSQTGFTSRYGKLIACILKEKGIAADLADMRKCDKKHISDYDLILVGSPVFYYDIPSNVSSFLTLMPRITGVPVAAFVSFGGPEGNQHNALCHALRLLNDAGGAAVGMAAFRSIPSYPTPTWDSANQRAGEHLPDASTYRQVRSFTEQVIERISRGESITYESEISAREILRTLPLVWFNKKAITNTRLMVRNASAARPVSGNAPLTQSIRRSSLWIGTDVWPALAA